MSSKKKVTIKSKQKVEKGGVEKDAENEIDVVKGIEDVDSPKAKKIVDLEQALEPANIIVEEESDSPTTSEDSEESAGDEISLDDDEINPFGDKWEQ